MVSLILKNPFVKSTFFNKPIKLYIPSTINHTNSTIIKFNNFKNVKSWTDIKQSSFGVFVGQSELARKTRRALPDVVG